MKTKDEQLKIYAAYLPYKLEVWHSQLSKAHLLKRIEVRDDGDHLIEICKDITIKESMSKEWIKPILWDLSYLTKEIEHEGEKVNLQEELHHLDFEWLIGNPKLASKLNQEDFDILLEHHFNVFNLDESEYINKATLKD